ncbi:FAD dependent oxidoreductase [Panaeolus papilionaceus]|nr:FAD dependent oxidoreductase [Panaeolus papilionaceus]
MPKHIVVLGGGIIGCTTAYYLVHHPSFSSSGGDKITLIEASKYGCAQGASGKAGGLVARWAYPKEIVNVSFDEHVKLAEKHNGKDRWGWRYVGCASWEGRGEVVVEQGLEMGSQEEAEHRNKSLEKELGLPGGKKPLRGAQKRENGLPADLSWVKDELTDSYSPMAGEGGTAQVHPYYFTTSMLSLAKETGSVDEITGRVTKITRENGSVTGIEYIVTEEDGTEMSKSMTATHVVVAEGAWSPNILPEIPIAATRAHSITIRPRKDVEISPYVLFTEIEDPNSSSKRAPHSSPEIYARPDGEVYACGPGDDEPLPKTVDDVQVDSTSCDLIFQQVSSISQQLREGTVEKRQACYLPSVSAGGGPIIGEASDIAKGLYIGTGHTCWGICNAPGTARALSELILTGKITCANLKKLRPSVLL